MRAIFLLINFCAFTASLFAQFTSDMNFTNSEDESINPSSILENGQYIYLDFYSTTCGACNNVAPAVNNAFETYGSNAQNVFFMGVDNFSSASACVDFSSSHNSEMPVIAGQEGGATIFSLFNQTSYPKGILIDPYGNIVTVMSYSSIASLTESLEAFVSPINDCDLIEVNTTYLNAQTGQVELSITAETSYLYGYPSFAIYNLDGDTLATEQVNYYGLSGETTHYLELFNPIESWETELILQLYSGFYQTMECSFSINSTSIETVGCIDEQAANYNYNATISNGSCLYNSNYYNSYINIESGWNLVGFSCANSIDAMSAFSPYTDNVVIVKDYLGTAYLPEYGFNGIGNLERGYGYQLKISEAIDSFNLCNPE
jgi:thiol-disulfide isomerase/thioredoxin